MTKLHGVEMGGDWGEQLDSSLRSRQSGRPSQRRRKSTHEPSPGQVHSYVGSQAI